MDAHHSYRYSHNHQCQTYRQRQCRLHPLYEAICFGRSRNTTSGVVEANLLACHQVSFHSTADSSVWCFGILNGSGLHPSQRDARVTSLQSRKTDESVTDWFDTRRAVMQPTGRCVHLAVLLAICPGVSSTAVGLEFHDPHAWATRGKHLDARSESDNSAPTDAAAPTSDM